MRSDRLTEQELAQEQAKRMRILKQLEKKGVISRDQTAYWDDRKQTWIGAKRIRND